MSHFTTYFRYERQIIVAPDGAFALVHPFFKILPYIFLVMGKIHARCDSNGLLYFWAHQIFLYESKPSGPDALGPRGHGPKNVKE